MSVVSEIIAALVAISPSAFALVEGADEFASIDTRPTALPAAYVLVEEENSAPSERLTGPVLQRCEIDVAVVIVTENVSDATGGAAASDIEALKQKVRAALIGLVPTGAQDGTPVEHVSGALLKARGGTIWHREVFLAVTYLEES